MFSDVDGAFDFPLTCICKALELKQYLLRKGIEKVLMQES